MTEFYNWKETLGNQESLSWYQPELLVNNRCHHLVIYFAIYTLHPPPPAQPVCLNHPLGTCHKMPLSFMSSWAPGCKVLKGKNHENGFQSFFILTWHLPCYKFHCILGKLSLVRQVSPGAGVTGVGDGRQGSKTAEDMVWVGGLCWAGQGGAGKQLQMLSSSWGPLETENQDMVLPGSRGLHSDLGLWRWSYVDEGSRAVRGSGMSSTPSFNLWCSSFLPR